jgi:L-ascorbate metabolism protein UlaG (beta-lactamase superfamily)
MPEGFTWFQQSAYLWRGDGLAVYIDPWGVTKSDPADVVFITHSHFDHFVLEDIDKIRKAQTRIVAPKDVARELSGEYVVPVEPGSADEVAGVKFTAVPAYNIVEDRLDNHPKSNQWVGYILTLGDETYYHAGDTDHVPELDDVRAGVAFLPIGGGGFTMTASEAAGLAKTITPNLAVPMHYGYVEGCATYLHAERFAKEADPVKVEIMTPENPFTLK